ncbi:MAG: VWA domain-containing protein [Vicinamibacteria bacterium]
MSSRRLPVYLLLDTSGSMRGEPIQSVNVGLQAMLNALRQDPYSLESVHLSVITFDVEAKTLIPLTPIESVQLPEITVPGSGATFLGAALELVTTAVRSDVLRSSSERKGDWRPMLFLMTDGNPSDLQAYRDMIPAVRALNFASVVACAAGPKAKVELLRELTDQVYSLDTTDSATFSQFFKWVSASVAAGSSSAGLNASNALPEPPAGVNVVL